MQSAAVHVTVWCTAMRIPRLYWSQSSVWCASWWQGTCNWQEDLQCTVTHCVVQRCPATRVGCVGVCVQLQQALCHLIMPRADSRLQRRPSLHCRHAAGGPWNCATDTYSILPCKAGPNLACIMSEQGSTVPEQHCSGGHPCTADMQQVAPNSGLQ